MPEVNILFCEGAFKVNINVLLILLFINGYSLSTNKNNHNVYFLNQVSTLKYEKYVYFRKCEF